MEDILSWFCAGLAKPHVPEAEMIDVTCLHVGQPASLSRTQGLLWSLVATRAWQPTQRKGMFVTAVSNRMKTVVRYQSEVHELEIAMRQEDNHEALRDSVSQAARLHGLTVLFSLKSKEVILEEHKLLFLFARRSIGIPTKKVR